MNQWSIEHFGNSLSVVWDIRECSVNDFLNKPDGAYAGLFSGLSGQMAKKKMHKYSFDEIVFMQIVSLKQIFRYIGHIITTGIFNYESDYRIKNLSAMHVGGYNIFTSSSQLRTW